VTTPLTVWICDTCGENITAPGKAIVTWREDDSLGSDFRIVHKNMDGRRCDPGVEGGFRLSTELLSFLGADGLAYAMSLLSAGPIMGDSALRVRDFDGFVDLVRRTQTPWYEEARPFWQTEDTQHWLADANEVYPYCPDVLRRIAEQELDT
jgi:hypothetical protein